MTARKKPVAEPPEHPNYYMGGNGIECLEAIRAELGLEGYIAYIRGTITAYNWWLGRKGDADDARMDAQKMLVYTGFLNEALKELP